jgi:hypothetical protein
MRLSSSLIGSHSTLQADSRAVFDGTPRECPQPPAAEGGTAQRADPFCGRFSTEKAEVERTAEKNRIIATVFIFRLLNF